jgi:hypothetical protein
VVVRTWNLFHGNAHPPERRGFLREMVELVTADRPGIVCLQEVPLWAFAQLETWSGMRAVTGVGLRPRVVSARLGGWLTELHHGLLRSALTGEGVAILVAHGLSLEPLTPLAVGPGRVLARTRVDGVLVGSFHVTGGAVAPRQLRRVVELVGGESQVVLAGDANLRPPYELDGWSEPLAGSIDQILVRGMPSTPALAWPEERRRIEGRVVSDHAPVELTVG